MLIETLSVFPGVFGSYLGASIMGRAQDKGSSSLGPTTFATGRMTGTVRLTMLRSAVGRACS